MAASSAAPSWTPELMGELLIREFVKGEDVAAIAPPLPPAPPTCHGFYADTSDSMRFLSKYVRLGPSVAAAALQPSQSQNGQQHRHPSSKPSTPRKGAAAAHHPPGTRTPKAAPNGALPPRTPKAKDNGAHSTPSTPSNAKEVRLAHGSREDAEKAKRRPRFEWPRDVPTNAQLKTENRHAVRQLREARIRAQANVDFDLVFRQQSGDVPLERIFHAHPKALKKVAAVRGQSGDWRNDVFTHEEEVLYKADIGIAPQNMGPSQAQRVESLF